MQSLIFNTINYKLCLNDEAKSLFISSPQELVKSNCSDFMVYRVVNGNIRNLPDYDDWQEVLEIDEDIYGELHLNLCQKIGKIVRRRNI